MVRALTSLLTLGLWSLAGGAILILLTGTGWFVLSPIGGVASPVVVLFCMLMVAKLVRRQRERRGFTAVGYLEQAARLNLPLPETLRAAELSERGGTAKSLSDLRRALEAGMPVGEALERYLPEVPERDQREIAVGERIGRLAPTLSRVHRRTLRRLRGEQGDTDEMLGWSYGAIVSTIALLLLGLITWLILPKYIEIFEDFDIAMPWQTQLTFSLGSSLAWALLPLSVLIVMVLAGSSLWSLGNRRKESWLEILGLDSVLSRLPWIGRAWQDRAWASGYAAAADAVAAGYALPDALRLSSETLLTRRVRTRLLRLADRLDQGQGLSDATRAAGLPELSCGLLGAVESGGDAEQTFGFLSRYHGQRFSRAWSVLRAAVLPGVVIVLALAVGWVVYSLFLPLIELIYSVTPEWESF
ncbi:MAG: type II secretion system F family protein [Planctomycetota bacterium]